MAVDRRRFERLLLNYLDAAEAEGHPYPELVAIDRFMKSHERFGPPQEEET